MSVNKLVSIKNAVYDAMGRVGIDHDKLIPLFTRWATLAEKEIGSMQQYVTKREVLNITHCTACLPEDAIYIELAVMGDHGCDCTDLMNLAYGYINNSGVVTETPSFLIVDVSNDGVNSGARCTGFINYIIQNNKLVFANDYDGQKITIQYLATVTDCDGFSLIGQNHVLAITEYIIWMYYFRKTSMNSLEYGKMNMAKAEWERLCLHARATDGQITDNERYEIVHGILHNPYIGISLSTGMHRTLDNTYWG